MDRDRFDALARLLATKGSRRGALGALFGAALFGQDPDDGLAKPGKKKKQRSGKDQRKSSGRDKDKGKGRGQDKGRKDKSGRQRAQAEAIPAGCCSGFNCTPGPGKNLQKCCYEGQNLSGRNFTGANLGSANFKGANLSGARFPGANLNKACFVDADLTGVTFNGSTNLAGAVFCRTQTDSGEDNSGCNRGTTCCETCPEECPDNERCCPDGTCQECCNNRQCPEGQRCVGGSCVCNAASCPNGCCTNGPGNPGECRPSSDDTCGINGAQCVDCPAGLACNAQGQCVCNAAGCPNGCCTNGPGNPGECRRPQPNNDACGINGAQCVDCPAGLGCDAQGRCVCNAASCPGGCCDTPNGPCITPPTSDNCGINGNICVECIDNAVCSGGLCQCAPGFKLCGPQCIPNASCCTGASVGCAQPTPNCCVINNNGVCRDCCDNGDCGNPAPICNAGGTCVPCTSTAQCGPGRICCGGQCFAGVCCAFAGPCRPHNACCNILNLPPSRSCCVGPGGGRCCLRNATAEEFFTEGPTTCVQDSDCCNGDCTFLGLCGAGNPDSCPA